MRLELAVEKEVVSWAKAHGILPLKLNTLANTGWPDRMFIFRGRIVFIEFKREKEDLKRNQPERIAQMVRAGCVVGVLDTYEKGTYFLETTLLSGGWGTADDKSGRCWVALEARAGKDKHSLHGRTYLAGEEIRLKDPYHRAGEARV